MTAPSVTHEAISALLVEDNPADIYLVRRLLADTPDFPTSVEAVSRLSTALDRLHRDGVDLVLLDLSLPDSNGLATFRRLAADGVTLDHLVAEADRAMYLHKPGRGPALHHDRTERR